MGHPHGAIHLSCGRVGLELWRLSSAEIYIWEVNSTLTINEGKTIIYLRSPIFSCLSNLFQMLM